MAIRRCPYCKAIIDEQDKYCNNCGTQLLFPEDEYIEEEIPGDKIIDDEEPDEEPEEEDTAEEKERKSGLEEDEEFSEDEEAGEGDTDEVIVSGTRPGDSAEIADEEEGQVARMTEETAAPVAGESEELREELEETEEEEEGPADIEEKKEHEEVEEEDESARPGAAQAGKLSELDKKYELALEDDELVLRTKDIAGLSGTADKRITEKQPIPDTGSLPPWVSRIRETPATVELDEEAQAEPGESSREWTTDSGIGVPERITQATLPIADTSGLGGPTPSQETDHVDEEMQEATAEEEGAGRSEAFSLKLRAKVVDLLFVTALWVISLYFTAQVIGVSFFRLIFGSPFPVLAFYAILLGLYFFLFLFFLGETLGDHYFSE